MKSELKKISLVLLTASVVACNNTNNSDTTAEDNSTPTETTVADKQGEWIELFDGKTLVGWHGFNKTGEIPNWTVEEGALVCLGAAKDASGGDIVTDKKFEDFELEWDWKVDKGSNSGVMYHVVEDPKYKAPYETETVPYKEINYEGKAITE